MPDWQRAERRPRDGPADTLGLWKVVGTPIEGVQGETCHATITYDRGDKVVEIKSKKKGSTV